ncbi:hypothetical protein MTO96_021326 [Rhipicephalus appendiculatus]
MQQKWHRKWRPPSVGTPSVAPHAGPHLAATAPQVALPSVGPPSVAPQAGPHAAATAPQVAPPSMGTLSVGPHAGPHAAVTAPQVAPPVGGHGNSSTARWDHPQQKRHRNSRRRRQQRSLQLNQCCHRRHLDMTQLQAPSCRRQPQQSLNQSCHQWSRSLTQLQEGLRALQARHRKVHCRLKRQRLLLTLLPKVRTLLLWRLQPAECLPVHLVPRPLLLALSRAKQRLRTAWAGTHSS